jgi:hypothetical protein
MFVNIYTIGKCCKLSFQLHFRLDMGVFPSKPIPGLVRDKTSGLIPNTTASDPPYKDTVTNFDLNSLLHIFCYFKNIYIN